MKRVDYDVLFIHFQSMVKRPGLIPFLIFIAVMLIYPAFELQIQLGLWHLWHGNTIRFQIYDIPVPASWFANQSIESSVDLVEAGHYRTRNELASVIAILSSGSTDITARSDLNEQWLRSDGKRIFDRRIIEFGDEKADCIVSDGIVPQNLNPGDKYISIQCQSAALFIIFTGDKQYSGTFFSVVSQINRQNDVAQNQAAANPK